jgi:hypothetical protein
MPRSVYGSKDVTVSKVIKPGVLPNLNTELNNAVCSREAAQLVER